MMASLELKMQIEPRGLFADINAMAEYLDAHEVGTPCPFVDLAQEIGEIDADTDICVTVEKRDSGVCAVFEPRNNLARLLDAFRAIAP